MKCDRICSMNDPDKGCLLGGVEECRIGSEQVMHRVRCDFPIGQQIPIDALLIDANVVLAAIDKEFHKTDPSVEEQIGFLKCRRIVRTAPTVDAVAVVRCGECVHKRPLDKKEMKLYGPDAWFCTRQRTYEDVLVEENHFCSYGERKNTENSRDLSGYADKLQEIKEGL